MNRFVTALGLLTAGILAASAQPANFTYQGLLTDQGAPANGWYDLEFNLFAADTGGTALTGAAVKNDVGVTNGLFTVTLDFTTTPFDGNARWLEIAVRPGASGDAYTNLIPRQPITAAPYAIKAISAMTVNMGTISDPSFIGTTTGTPLEFFANNQRGLQLQYGSNFLGETVTVIGGYSGNSVGAGAEGSVIAGGGQSGHINSIGNNSFHSAISGGRDNNIAANSRSSTIVGGELNSVQGNAQHSLIGGGYANLIRSNTTHAVIMGGMFNDIQGFSSLSVIGGGSGNGIAVNAYASTIAGGENNYVAANSSSGAIGGGGGNWILSSSPFSTVPGGQENYIRENARHSAVGGGFGNVIQGFSFGSTIAGGDQNHVQSFARFSAIGGGQQNSIASNSYSSAIAGGELNDIGVGASRSVIGGGSDNTIASNAQYAVIPGGAKNAVGSGASHAFAAGRRAKANHAGVLVWGDSTNADVVSTNENSVTLRASGGIRFFSTTNSTSPAPGVYLSPGDSAWSTISDKNTKRDISQVDAVALLEKLARVPVQQWHYQWEDASAPPHLGPMAQDFKAAFYPGRDDRSITTLEFDGVALAAIQGLNQKLTEELKRRDAENAELKQAVSELRNLIQTLVQKGEN